MWAASGSKTLPKARYYIRSVRYYRTLIEMLQNNGIMFEQVGKASMNASFSRSGSRHGHSHIYFLYFEIGHDIFLSLLFHNRLSSSCVNVTLSNHHMSWFNDIRTDQELICFNICHGGKEGKIKICH